LVSDALHATYTSSVLSELRYVSSSVSAITSSGPIGIYGSGTYGSSSYGINVERKFTGSFAEFQDYLPKVLIIKDILVQNDICLILISIQLKQSMADR
jgi:hypothetical protein